MRAGKQRIDCRVSMEAIEDVYGTPPNEARCLDAAQAHFDQLTDKFGNLIAIGRYEPDGTILVRKSDL